MFAIEGSNDTTTQHNDEVAMKRHRTTSVITLLTAACLTGCSVPEPFPDGFGNSTTGLKGNAEFSMNDSFGCGLGCDLSRPLAVGATESLQVRFDGSEDGSGLWMTSTDPAIFCIDDQCAAGGSGGHLAQYPSMIGMIVGEAPGTARVGVYRTDGQPGGGMIDPRTDTTADEVDVIVAAPASIECSMFDDNDVDTLLFGNCQSGFTAEANVDHSLVAIVRDDLDRHLYANDAVTWTVVSGAAELSHPHHWCGGTGVDPVTGECVVGPRAIPEDRTHLRSAPGTSRIRGTIADLVVEFDVGFK